MRRNQKFMAYSDEEINNFLAMAQEVGITRAMRELGYPQAWSTAQYWAKNRGVEVAIDAVMQKAAGTREWYKTEEVFTIAQEGMNRVYQELVENNQLTPDDQKKLAEAFVKHYNVWANAQGKATNITESRESDVFDERYKALLHEMESINSEKKVNDTESL